MPIAAIARTSARSGRRMAPRIAPHGGSAGSHQMPLDKGCPGSIKKLILQGLLPVDRIGSGQSRRLTMSDPQPVNSSTLNRRKFLTVAGAGVAGGSLLTMLQARQAPAQIKGTTLRILQWSHFIPAYDAWFDNVFVKEWGEKNGVKVRVDHIPHLELPARMAAEFAAGAGHDIIHNG